MPSPGSLLGSLWTRDNFSVILGSMSLLLQHRNVVFEDDTVYLSGHAYFNCTFIRCTLILRDSESHMEECVFNSCVWHIDWVLHDVEQFRMFQAILQFIESSLVRSAESNV